MASIAKTVVATGGSSGLGFETVKQLLQRQQPYKFIIGARDLPTTQAAFDKLDYDGKKHSVSILKLDLSDMKTVRPFAQQALTDLGKDNLDLVFLNAAIVKSANGLGLHGSPWCEPYMVNHLSQHYLTHLLHEKIRSSHSRVVVTSSGAVRMPNKEDIPEFATRLKANSGAGAMDVYGMTKFIQFLGAHWWRRHLGDSATVLAVSPGMIPTTGMGRYVVKGEVPDMTQHPDARSVEEGARNLVRAIDITDFPENPEQIFLTSWGEWWAPDVYGLSLDKELQDKWCPSEEESAKEGGLDG